MSASTPPLRAILALLVVAAVTRCSAGSAPTAPEASPTPPGPSVALSGQIVDQFGGLGMAGVVVRFAGGSAVTDASGRFSIQGAASDELRAIVVEGGSIHARETYVAGLDAPIAVVPAGFDMTGFDDVGRERGARTIRWLSTPRVYVDTRVVGGTVSPADLQLWIDEVKAQVPGLVSQWTGGALSGVTVTVGDAPPADGTAGTLVVRFDEDPSGYTGEKVAGMTQAWWTTDGVITAARIRLRFSGLVGPAAAFSVQAVLGHEIGHALGMNHMDGAVASIMTPVIRTPVLTEFDRAAGRILYGRASGNANVDRDSRYVLERGLAPAAAPSTSFEWAGARTALN